MRQPGRHKCREDWSSQISARTYNLFLDVVLLLVPLLVMGLAYALIVSKLWKGLRCELRHPDTPSNLVSNSNHLQGNSLNIFSQFIINKLFCEIEGKTPICGCSVTLIFCHPLAREMELDVCDKIKLNICYNKI